MSVKKRKGSIIRSVIIMLTVMALTSISMSSAVSYGFNMDDIKTSAGHNARISAKIITDLANTYDIENPQHKSFLERELQYLMETYSFDSLLIFSVDEKGGVHVITGMGSNAMTDPIEAASWGFHGFKNSTSQKNIHNNDPESTQLWKVNRDGKKYYVSQHPVYITNISFDNCYVGTIYPAEAINNSIISEMLWFAVPSAMVVLLTLVFVLLFLNRNMLQPIKHIAGHMNQFTTNYGKEDKRIEICRENEIGEIAAAFNKMSEDIAVMIRDVNVMQAERLNEKAQMDAAKSIQQGIVPRRTLIRQADFEVCAAIRPAKEVGGDFYDCFILGDGRLCMVIGDVSGKGVSAALFMIMVKSEIKTRLNAGVSPAEVLNKVNEELCGHNPELMFATAFVAVYDPKTRDLCFTNAGHNPPVLFDGEPHIMQVDSGIALGLFENSDLEDMHIRLREGESLLIYTDGVTEAINEKGEWFGTEPLLRLPAGSAELLISTLEANVDEHYNGREQFDDLTALALTISGNEHMLLPDAKSLIDIRSILERQFGGRTPKKIMLACEEAFINIVNYSGADDIRLQITRSGNSLTAELTDNGIAFDPVRDGPPAKDPDDFDTGGMGVSIIKQSTKHLYYKRKDGQNILSMTFDTEGFADAD